MSKKTNKEIPAIEQLEAELERVKYKKKYRSTLRSTIYALITVAAVAVLTAKIGRAHV